MQTAARKVHGIAVVAGRDASEVLQAAEHALDGVAVAIEEWREAVLPLPICLWRVQDVAVRKRFEQRLSSGESATCPPVSMKANGRH